MTRPIFLLAASAAAITAAGAADPPPPGFEKPDRSFVIRTVAAQMKYDTPDLLVAPGHHVKVVLKNEDQLPHNIVFLSEKGVALPVAMKAWELGEQGAAKNWIPDDTRVLAFTKMTDPGHEETVWFKAPEVEGDYDFVCTFPGHATVMHGTLHVSTAPPPGLSSLTYIIYKGAWEKLPDFSTLEKAGLATDEINDGLIDIAVAKMNENFGIVFDATLTVPISGDFQFDLGSDDGSRLWIDNQVVVDNDGVHPHGVKSGRARLTKGPHVLKVAYFEQAGDQSLTLDWSGPGFRGVPLSKVDGQPRAKRGREGEPLMLRPADHEAIIYRGFMDHAGGSRRMIDVGFPGQMNLGFDQDQMRLGLLWKGEFIDARRHWSDRGAGDEGPAGYAVVELAGGENFAVLQSPDVPWPLPGPDHRAPHSAFKGYSLDAQRIPTFRYVTEGVEIEDRPAPRGELAKGNEAIVRSLVLHAAQAPANFYFRASAGRAIEAVPDGRFKIGQNVTVAFDAASKPVIRGQELLVPVPFTNGAAQLTVIYTWY